MLRCATNFQAVGAEGENLGWALCLDTKENVRRLWQSHNHRRVKVCLHCLRAGLWVSSLSAFYTLTEGLLLMKFHPESCWQGDIALKIQAVVFGCQQNLLWKMMKHRPPKYTYLKTTWVSNSYRNVAFKFKLMRIPSNSQYLFLHLSPWDSNSDVAVRLHMVLDSYLLIVIL